MFLINYLIFVITVILAAFATKSTAAAVFPAYDILEDPNDTINSTIFFNSTQDGQLFVESRGGGGGCLKFKGCCILL
jgi:hypothetical protein